MTAAREHGRKYALTLLGIKTGVAVTLLGMLAAVLKPEAASAVAQMVLGFSGILGMTISAYSGANAYAEGKAGPTTVVKSVSETTVTQPKDEA